MNNNFFVDLQKAARDFYDQDLTDEQRDGLKAIYKDWDTDGNGFLSLDELKEAYKNNAWTSKMFDILWPELDVNSDGRLSFDEAIPLFYAIFVCMIPFCDNCNDYITQKRYWTKRIPAWKKLLKEEGYTYDLCPACYSEEPGAANGSFEKIVTLNAKQDSPITRALADYRGNAVNAAVNAEFRRNLILAAAQFGAQFGMQGLAMAGLCVIQ